MVETLLAGESTKDEDSDVNEDQVEALTKKLKAAGLAEAAVKRNQVDQDNQLVK